ncbi:MAG: restriction endonuclease subunit S [Chitinophagales bacterium]|nr:restriction endonuclease subunit S [Chitinophagales bacterium]
MKQKLKYIASIASGVYEKVHPSGDTFYLQGKDFDEYGRIRRDMKMLPELLANERLEKHLLRDGDILLIAKGESNRACLYQEAIGPAVASSTFFVIRPAKSELLPEYMQWYFNTRYMKDIFSGLSKGTQIASLSKKTLAEIEIPVPPLREQKKILEIQRLWEHEKSLTLKLMELKDLNIQKLLLKNSNSIQ